jgi:hypothetical protein
MLLRHCRVQDGGEGHNCLLTTHDSLVPKHSEQASQVVAEAERACEAEETAVLKATGLYDFELRVKWSKTDLSAREKLDPVMKAWLNSSCFRKHALAYPTGAYG